MLDELEENFGIEDFNQFRPIPEPQFKCNLKLSKNETANLFNAFFETGYFYFDITNKTQYKRAKIKFIENNSITHLTSNLSASEIELLYGNRLRSRMRNMFNLISFNVNSNDKR